MDVNQPPTPASPKLAQWDHEEKFLCCGQNPNLTAFTDQLKFREHSVKYIYKLGTQKQINYFIQ